MSTTFGAVGQGNGTLTVTRPSVSSGQLMTAILYGLFSDAAVAPPSGWTLRADSGVGINDRPTFYVYTKVAGGSEPTTYSWVFTGSSNGQHHANGWIAVTTDADTTTPINVVGATTRNFSGSTNSITIAGVTTTTPTVLIALVGDGANTYTTHTFTPPAGFTEVIEGANSGYGGGAFATFTKGQPTTGATGNFTATRSANYFGNLSIMVAIALSGGGDTTAPTLTSPTATSTGSTTATGTVSTNEGNGTLYRLATTNATETAATVKAANQTQTVTATGVQNVTFSGLTASTTYYAHYVHTDAAANDSTRVSSASFTTSAGGDVTPPVLTSPTASATSSTTASGSVSTNEANGTLYRYVSTNASESAATVKAASLTSTVTATGAQAVGFTGLTANTTYYAHYVHRDAAGNDSAVSSSTGFLTPALATATFTIPLVNNTNSPLVGLTVPKVLVCRFSDMTSVLNLTSQTSNGSGNIVVNSASLSAGTAYAALMLNADGTVGGWHYGVAT